MLTLVKVIQSLCTFLTAVYISRINSSTPSMSSSRRSISLIKDLTSKLLINLGHSQAQSQIITDVLMYAELRGNNQGIIKLITGGLNYNPLSSPIQRVFESPISAKLDGKQNIGMVVVHEAVEIAINKARSNGISIVGCSNYASATGALGAWASQITSHGYIGIVMSQCNEMVAPHGSYEPIFGTNPIAIGIPTLPRAQILDMATSSMAWYGLKLAEKEGASIPSNVAYDSNGYATTSPTEALHGALRVFDRSYKGSHLALMIELLAGAFTGASMEDKGGSNNWGSLVIAINPDYVFGLNTLEDFRSSAITMCDRVKNAKKLPTDDASNNSIDNDGGGKDDSIMLPGERGDLLMEENLRQGTIAMLDNVYDELVKLAQQ